MDVYFVIGVALYADMPFDQECRCQFLTKSDLEWIKRFLQ